MDTHVDPRLRTQPPPTTHSTKYSFTPSSLSTSPLPATIQHKLNRYPGLPSLPRPSLAENPVRLPPPNTPNRPSYPDSAHQTPYYQLQAPSHTTSDGPEGDGPEGANDQKRPRACESCRGLKVRCESDSKNFDGPCRRCTKAGRNCVVTVPSRKRQKKTDSRVAELERKIDALTASLHATKSEPIEAESGNESVEQSTDTTRRNTIIDTSSDPQPHQTDSPTDSRHHRTPTDDLAINTSRQYPTNGGLKRKHSSGVGRAGVHDAVGIPTPTGSNHNGASPTARDDAPTVYPFLMPKSKDSPLTNAGDVCHPNAPPQPVTEYADVIDRRILSAELATTIFNWYITDMAHHFPAVVFPRNTMAAEVRKHKPALFLAILAAAAGFSHPDIQRVLNKELMRVLAERVFINGEKSLELIQALHVSVLWYYPPEHHEELKFYQLIHIAAVMAIDLGMGKKAKPVQKKKPVASLWRDHPRFMRCSRVVAPDTIEARRCWLSCYFLGSNVSQSLRRPNLIKWSPYMDDCIDFITNSAEALPSDKQLCYFVRLQHIADEIGCQFSMDDPCAIVGLSDLKVQYALKNFERQLDDWKNAVPRELDAPSLRLNAHIVDLYMHEVALHVDHNIDDFHPPFTEETLKSVQGHNDMLTPTHIDALTTCLSSIHGSFDTFMSSSVDNVRTMPIFYHVRTAYCVVVLIKMYFAVSAQNGELGKVIGQDDLRVEHYLHNVLERYRQAAEDERCRPAGKFLMVLIMLKTWFTQQKQGQLQEHQKAVDAEASKHEANRSVSRNSNDNSRYPQILSGNTSATYRNQPDPPPQPLPNYSSANTPLQLLSEVAMGNQHQPNAGSSANVGSSQGAQPGLGWGYSYDQANGAGEVQYSSQMAPTSGVLPNASQAMTNDSGLDDNVINPFGIALGDEEFSQIFLNDFFFNLNVDGTPNAFGNWV